jgi:ketosteroid isomerase-like protein
MVGVLSALMATTAMAQNVEISVADLETWLGAYERAWERKDPDAAANLFAADARYFETPYAQPFEGQSGVRDYWTRVTADQRDIDFQYSSIAVDGDTGIASWSATFTTISGGVKVELNGVFVLAFDADKRCTVLREWWHAR